MAHPAHPAMPPWSLYIALPIADPLYKGHFTAGRGREEREKEGKAR